MADKIRLDFRVLLYREEPFWIAHCLETDLVAEAATVSQAVNDLVAISNVQIEAALEEGDLAAVFSPAPPEVWRMYSVAAEGPNRRPRAAVKQVNRIQFRQLVPA